MYVFFARWEVLSVVCCAVLRWGVWTACSRTCGVSCQWCLETESPVKWTCWRLRPSTSGSCQPCSNTPLPPWVSHYCYTSLHTVLQDITGFFFFFWQSNGDANVLLETGINCSSLETDGSDLWSMEDVSSVTVPNKKSTKSALRCSIKYLHSDATIGITLLFKSLLGRFFFKVPLLCYFEYYLSAVCELKLSAKLWSRKCTICNVIVYQK